MLNGRINIDVLTIILSNLLPLLGVFFLGWDPFSVFALYIIETIIIGLFHAFKLFYLLQFNEVDKSIDPKQTNQLPPKPVFLVPFFLFHFMFFVFVQTVLVFAGLNTGDGFLSAFGKLYEYTQGEYRWIVGSFTMITLFTFINEVFINKKYREVSYGKVFLEPYPRIFIQQFVVIIGGFITAITRSGIPLVIIFVVIKIVGEVLVTQGLVNWDTKKQSPPNG